jgi:hypothetical protein
MQTQQAAGFFVTSSTLSGSPADDNSILPERASFASLKMAVTELLKALSCALRDERDAAEQFVERAARLLDADAQLQELELAHPLLDSAKAAPRSGLAPWQIRKVKGPRNNNFTFYIVRFGALSCSSTRGNLCAGGCVTFLFLHR